MNKFWDTVDPTFSHIQYNKWLQSENNISLRWERQWLYRFPNLNGQVVFEYGIGGGLLAKHLFNTRNISKYIGVDIAARQISASRKRLKNYNVQLLQMPFLDAAKIPCCVDFFVTQAVLQHFESIAYFESFMRQVVLLRPQRLMIQTRHARMVQELRPARRSTPLLKDVQFALSLPTYELTRRLPGYHLIWASKITPDRYIFHEYALAANV